MSPRRPKLPGSAVDRLSATYQYLLGSKKKADQSGIQSSLNREVRDSLISDDLRQGMIGILTLLAQQGLCPARISEASLQIQETIFLVTRLGSWFQNLADEDLFLALAKTDRDNTSGLNPQHWDWHLEIFGRNPKVKAIILGFPSAAMALAAKGLLPRPDLLLDAAELIGKVRIWEPDRSPLSDLADIPHLVIIPGVGVLSLGSTLLESAVNLELLNTACEVTLLSNQIS